MVYSPYQLQYMYGNGPVILNIVVIFTSNTDEIVKQEIAENCEKYIRAKDTHVSLMIFSSEFKLVNPFVFLSFIFESSDRYKVFHMTHSCSYAVVACAKFVVIWWSEIKLRQN